MVSYEEAERTYGQGERNRKCMDGSVTGCGNCVGYCDFYEHPGFVTEKLCRERRCLHKKCHYYRAKPVRGKIVRNAFIDAQRAMAELHCYIREQARLLEEHLDGMKIVDIVEMNADLWELQYVTVTGAYENELAAFADSIMEATGSRVSFRDLEYPFETAAGIIFGE